MLIKPQTKAIENMHGETKEFIISRMPATVCREVIAKYPTSALPKIGDYETSEKTMLLMMKYVAVVTADGSELRLTTKELVNNHVDDVSQLLRLEYAMLEENTGFFGKGNKSGFLDLLLNKVVQSVMPMLTPLLGQLSVPDTPPSETSKPS